MEGPGAQGPGLGRGAAIAALVWVWAACTSPEATGPGATRPAAHGPAGLAGPAEPRGPVLVLTRGGEVRQGPQRWSLADPAQAARLTVHLQRLAARSEEPLIFRSQRGTPFTQVELLMRLLELAELEDYRLDLNAAEG